MAITPTGAIFKTLSFDGKSLRSYGVYISGEATFNAPAREVEMISIPGRSGQLALDKGRFENIEVTYPAGIYADTEADFAEAVSELRNFLCSRSGYCRIEDDYNPNEFRMGIYKSGLEVTPALLKAGEFDLVFDCKPQRWLKSGEDEIEVQDGDTITNPTLFESSPLLEVEGYGTIEFNGYGIDIENAVLGNVTVYETKTSQFSPCDYQFNPAMVNIGDSASISIETRSRVWVKSVNNKPGWFVSSVSASCSDADFSAYMGEGVSVTRGTIDITIGTDKTITNTTSGTAQYQLAATPFNVNYTITQTITYTAATNTITVSVSGTASGSVTATYGVDNDTIGELSIYADSTVSILGNPTYVDCDLGEAYKIENDEYISLNRYIDLGSDLPRLAPGANAFEIDNTITDLKVVPRWWIV